MALDSNVSWDCNDTELVAAVDRLGGEADFYDRFTISRRVERVLLPLWIAVGVPGALISFTVWINRRMRFSSHVYLAALALLDLSFLLLQIPWYLQESWATPVMDLPVICQLYPFLNYALQYGSPLLTLGFTAERYISVCHPFRHEALCTTRRAAAVTAAMMGFALALASAQIYFYQFNATENSCSEREELSGRLAPVWTGWSLATELLLFAVVPFAILIINVRVIVEMRRVAGRGPPGGQGSGRQTAATTVMLLCVSFFLIFTTLPVTIAYVLYFSFPAGTHCPPGDDFAADPAWSRHFTFLSVRAAIDNFARSHYAVKFYIYMATGRQFRRQFTAMYCPARCRRDEEHSKATAVTCTAAIPLVGNPGSRRAANGRRR